MSEVDKMFFKKAKKEDTNIKLQKIPEHIAFIMDGNGRWAKSRNRPRTFGHQEGTKTIRKIALECNRLGVKAMTVYAFSTENFARPESEVNFIFKLPEEFFNLYFEELHKNNVKITVIGHLEKAPKRTQEVIGNAMAKTQNNTGLILCFAFIYGGQDEILEATKNVARDFKAGKIVLEELDEKMFSNYLMTKDLPDCDLMIRTSGEQRLSNFLLWQLAYAEFIFTETFWPDFDEQKLHECLLEYQSRDRRFGGLK